MQEWIVDVTFECCTEEPEPLRESSLVEPDMKLEQCARTPWHTNKIWSDWLTFGKPELNREVVLLAPGQRPRENQRERASAG